MNKEHLISIAKEAGLLHPDWPNVAGSKRIYEHELTKFAELLRAIIEQDNVEPVAYQIWWDKREWLYTADKEDFDIATRNNMPITPLYLHPPKDSTEPASKDSDEAITYIINIREKLAVIVDIEKDYREYGIGGGTYTYEALREANEEFVDAVSNLPDSVKLKITAIKAAAPTTPKGE